jgi:hypothetical protein
MAFRMEQVTVLPTNMSEELQIQAQIELRAPRYLDSQRHLRSEKIACTRRDTTAVRTKGRRSKVCAKPEEEIDVEQSNNDLTIEELTAVNDKLERSKKVAAENEDTTVDLEKVTDLEKKQKNFDKVLVEENQDSE